MGFNKFKEVFDSTYNSLYSFVNSDERAYENIECPFEFEEIENLDETSYDSYGNEDSDLRRIFYIKDFDIYVEFYGNRSSYQGEEWYGYKQVNKTTKTISIWN